MRRGSTAWTGEGRMGLGVGRGSGKLDEELDFSGEYWVYERAREDRVQSLFKETKLVKKRLDTIFPPCGWNRNFMNQDSNSWAITHPDLVLIVLAGPCNCLISDHCCLSRMSYQCHVWEASTWLEISCPTSSDSTFIPKTIHVHCAANLSITYAYCTIIEFFTTYVCVLHGLTFHQSFLFTIIWPGLHFALSKDMNNSKIID